MNWSEKIQRYYNEGRYTDEQIRIFAKAGKIIEEEFKIITGKEYEADS